MMQAGILHPHLTNPVKRIALARCVEQVWGCVLGQRGPGLDL